MHRFFKYKLMPYVIGFLNCILLMISRVFSVYYSENSTIGALNTILIIAILCLFVHMIRSTAAMYEIHVWNSFPLTMLWLIPVFNLLVTAAQLIMSNPSFLSTKPFTAVIIIFSLPTYVSYYFMYVALHHMDNNKVRIISTVISFVAMVYMILRLCDKIIIPIAVENGIAVNEMVKLAAERATSMSMLIYILGAVGFLMIDAILKPSVKNAELEEHNS